MKTRLAVVAVSGGLVVVGFLLIFGTRHSSVRFSTVITNETDKTFPPASSHTISVANKIPAPSNSLSNSEKNLSTSTAEAAPQSVSAMRTTSIPNAPEFTNLPPETVMENLRTVFRTYQSMFRENPVGTNPEITQALDGGNRKQAHFLNEEDGLRVNARGEMIDSWGTPYFFHQLSGAEMEIHSAGPDRIMWTKDDLVIK